ncbi:MAG: hypothetical protein WCX65_11415 [bacterium]
MFETDTNAGQMILLDCMSSGIPWPESRKILYKNAPEACREALSPNSSFFDFEDINEVGIEALKDASTLERAFNEVDEYLFNPRSSVRVDEQKLRWYAGCEKSGSSMHFYYADLREHKIKTLFHRQCWSAYHSVDHSLDQAAALIKYYNRILHTFRRIKFVRWIKLVIRDGRVRIYIYNEKAAYPNPNIQLILERALFREEQPASCELLHGELWKAWPHVCDRIDFWRLEETGGLTDEILNNALKSGDEALVPWAISNLNNADNPFAVELIKKQIQSNSLDEAKAAVRTAGRLWLKDLEQDVMRQYNLRGNAIGPAVADFIGSLGVTGRSFLPKILRALTRRGDFATLIPTIRALGAFPHSSEAKALPDVLSVLLGLTDDVEPILERFPGIRTDIYGPHDPPVQLQITSLEALREEAVCAIIETTAHYSDPDTFAAVARQISIESPYIEKLLEEIESRSRSDAHETLLKLLHSAAQREPQASPVPVTRRAVLVARTLMRITDPDERLSSLLAALHHISYHVGSYRRDSELGFNFHIDNYPTEPYITINSIIKGLPDEHDIIKGALESKNLSEKERYLIQELAGE